MTACTACGSDNKPGRKFCASCGAAMVSGCPACGTPFDPGERFCGECGGPLPAAASVPAAPPRPVAPAPVAERRLVSVLFADLVGFTPFAEERDAEDVRETLTRYFDLASEVIARYGGIVEKFIGDAVMAVWGTPVAHENDAERAVRAGMELVDAVRVLGPTIQARAGVLTGEAAVTIGATNQGMVAGDIVNTAARLQSVAPSGSVLVGEPTMRSASKGIAFEPAGDQLLKGKASPVPAFRALRVVAEVGGRNRQEGLEAPFVGRDDEMRTLKDQFHATAKDGRTRLVSVLGPAGIGKSRLARELGKYADGLAGTVWWHQGRSPAYGQGVTYWALGEMVRGRCGLLETDDPDTTRARVAATLEEHVPDAAERTWIGPALLALLGHDENGAAADQLFAAWRTFFERLAQTAPVVLLFEDLHWADTGTLDFIDHVLDWTRDLPILIVTLARPELIERRPNWGAGRRYFLSLPLDPLPESAMRELLTGLVPGLPARAAAAIINRADGVPLYAVETVRSLLAEGRLRLTDAGYEPVGDLSELAVPETLTALIASRLDALDPTDRSLLQDGAVLGKSFTPASLAAVAGQPAELLEPRLRALVRRELLVLEADPRSPERGQYAFVQALIREVAYNTLSRKDRRAKHLAAARWFESLGSDELAGALARHYLAAWQAMPDGPDGEAMAAQARVALRAAADRAAALNAHPHAVELYREALSVTTSPAERGELLVRASWSAEGAGRYAEALALAEDALALATERGDLLAEAAAVERQLAALVGDWRHAEALPLAEAAVVRFAPLRPDLTVLSIETQLANRYRREGRYEDALELLTQVCARADLARHTELATQLLLHRAAMCWHLGRVTESEVLFDGGLARARAIGREELTFEARLDRAIAAIADDPGASKAEFLRLAELGRRTGKRYTVIVCLGNAVEVAWRTGEWAWGRSAALEMASEELDPADRIMGLEMQLSMRVLVGEELSALEREADEIAAQLPAYGLWTIDRPAIQAWLAGDERAAIEGWEAYLRHGPQNAPGTLPRMIRSWLWAGAPDEARVTLARLEALPNGGRATDASVVTIRACLAAIEGDVETARRLFREANGAWRALNLPFDEALADMDLVRFLGPDDPDAPAAIERARTFFERVGSPPLLAKLDAAIAAGSEAAT